MPLPNKHVTIDMQHEPLSLSTQSLTSLQPDRLDGIQHVRGNSYNSDPSLDQRQRDKDLERQSVAPPNRSSSNNSIYRYRCNNSDGKHRNSTYIQTQTLQSSFEDLDRFQQQQLELKKGIDDGHSISTSSFTNNSISQQHSPSSPSYHSDLSPSTYSTNYHNAGDGYYASLTPPYAECPLVTDNLHLPVPTILHHYFIYDNDDDDDDTIGNKQSNNNDKTFETMVNQLCPYPFRSRAPLGNRLKRKPLPGEQQQDHDMDTAKRYPSFVAQQREKRHSLGNGQIDRLVHGRKSLLEENELLDLIYDPHQTSILDPLPPPPPPPTTATTLTLTSSTSTLDIPQQHGNQNNLLLEDRIHWLTQGYYLIPPTHQNTSPSPAGGHDPPPSLFSSPPSSSPLV